MLSVNDMFYNEKNEPVLVVGGDRARGRYLTRQDSRNFRSSRSPPPSRSHNHSSSWFGFRRSSQSPPRSRTHRYQSDYERYRDSKYGRSPERSGWFGRRRRGSESPPSSYHESRSHTKYKEDYTGYPSETGYTAENGYAPGYGHKYHGHAYHGYNSQPYTYGGQYASTTGFYGERAIISPRTYEAPYAGTSVYPQEYLETVKLKVPLCCMECEERISNHMLALEGVESVTCDQVKQKVTVRGTATPSEVLRQGRECFKHTRFW